MVGAEKVGACGRHVEDAFPGRFCCFYDPKKINVGVCYSNGNHMTGKYLLEPPDNSKTKFMIQESMIHFRRIRGQHTLSSLLSHTGAQQSTFSDLHLCFTKRILCVGGCFSVSHLSSLSFSQASSPLPLSTPARLAKPIV